MLVSLDMSVVSLFDRWRFRAAKKKKNIPLIKLCCNSGRLRWFSRVICNIKGFGARGYLKQCQRYLVSSDVEAENTVTFFIFFY